MKHRAARLAIQLRQQGFRADALHGNMNQSQRDKVMQQYRCGKLDVLVATDVAARGLDIENLSMVINYDLPVESENYVHRIGRTARAGKTGKAVTLASEQDVYELPGIERYIGKKLPSEIAMHELYEEDKSADMRIKTDFYEERQTSKRLSRKGIISLQDEKTRGAKKEKRHTRRHESTKVTEKKDRGFSDNVDLSKLSMEERMLFYKNKYTNSSDKLSKKRASDSRKTTSSVPPHSKEAQSLCEKTSSKPLKKGLIFKLIGIFKKK